MKKIAVLFMVAFIVLNIVINVPALIFADGTGYVKVHIDGKEVSLREVNVEINGQALESDVPPLIYDSRTLVPIRFVAEHLNAEVEWNQENQEATIRALGKEIVLKPNSSDVLINGEKKKLPYDVPAKIVNDGRTMVPLRFVSEELGCNVEWNQDAWKAVIEIKDQEILDIDIDMDTHYPRIVVETTGPILYNAIDLEDLGKLVIDIPNTTLNIQDENKIDAKNTVNLDVNKYPVEKVRSSQFKVNPNVTRIAIDLDKLIDYEINYFSDGKGFEINFKNTITDLKTEQVNGKQAIVIKGTSKTEFNTFVLENPNRVVIDLMSSSYEIDKYEYEIDNSFIENIRVAEFDHSGYYNENEQVVRVVLDIKNEAGIPDFTPEVIGNDLVLHLNSKDFNSINYNTKNQEKGILSIITSGEAQYDISYDEDKNTMEIKIPKDIIDTSDGTMYIDDGLVDKITIKEDGEKKVVLVKLKRDIEYSDAVKQDSREILITMEAKYKQFGDKLIIIDAGHGGKDPGTTGVVSKITEKELNLIVAKRLEKRLNEIGFKTLLTREDDVYIGLYERAEIANQSDGDAFLSIHFNAHYNPRTTGIETIYCPAYESDVKSEDNYPFVETIHSAIVDELNKTDRGISRRPEIVVTRETKMVAALLELGFISNPEDEKQILTFDYVDKAIEGIANGLIEYFGE